MERFKKDFGFLFGECMDATIINCSGGCNQMSGALGQGSGRWSLRGGREWLGGIKKMPSDTAGERAGGSGSVQELRMKIQV